MPPIPTLVGHRGLGVDSSFVEAGGHALKASENTLLSLTLAHQLGAQWVEIDVQLTLDLVPVVYHDFGVKLSSNAPSKQSDYQSLRVPLGRMTWSNLQGLGWPEPLCESAQEPGIARRNFRVCNALGLDLPACQRSFMSYLSHDFRLGLRGKFTKLETVLGRLAHTCGTNIELKYPSEEEARVWGLRPVPRKAYVAAILAAVHRNEATSRLMGQQMRCIMFSSFDPDVCQEIREDSEDYPVFFLTEGGTHDNATSLPDERMRTLPAALAFAKESGLQGVVTHASAILDAPEVWVQAAREAGLQLATYGSANNNPESAVLQARAGVDMLIVDHVKVIKRALDSLRLEYTAT